MLIVSIIATYQRPKITRDTIRWLNKQTKPCTIVLVGSDPDDANIASSLGCAYVEYNNRPLGAKWQAGLDEARKYDPDAIMICGSDDWLTANWIEECSKHIDKYDIVGKTSWYNCRIVNEEPLQLCKATYLSRKDPIGAGRLISKRILDKVDWQIFPVHKNTTLDKHSFATMEKNGAKIKILSDKIPAWLLCIKAGWACIDSWEHILATPSSSIEFEQNPSQFLQANYHGAPFNNYFAPVKVKQRLIIKPLIEKSQPVIGMITYNRPDYLAGTLESLKASKCGYKNLFIFDDGSADPSKLAMLRKIKNDYHIVDRGRNYGTFINTCLSIDFLYSISDEPYIILCQDDLQFSIGWLSYARATTNDLNREGIDWGILSLINLTGETVKPYYILPRGNPGGCCWIINRKMWVEYRKDNDIYSYKQQQGGTKHLSDFKITHWCNNNEYRQWAVCHVGKSLVKHIGARSIVGDKDMSEYTGKGFEE